MQSSLAVREGSLVEVADGPLRVSDDPHNFGIVTCIKQITGVVFADVVTNTGHHRLIEPDKLCVLSQMEDDSNANANRL